MYESVAARPYKVPPRLSVSASSKGKSVFGGVVEAVFCQDGRHLATREEAGDRVVWVWDLPELRLAALLVHADPGGCWSCTYVPNVPQQVA